MRSTLTSQPATLRAAAPSPRAGVFSIDLEDFAQLSCFYRTGAVPDVSADIDRQMDAVLATLAEHDVRATFFVLAMVASRRPDIVRRVHEAGHEVATHGSGHVQAFRQSRAEFKADVGDSIKILEDIIGEPVLGYRAPIFSIGRENLWALDVLAELGLVYDSSIFPVRLSRYGIDGFDPLPRPYALPEGGRLVEIPLLVVQYGRRRYPVAGGGYLRLMPQMLLRKVVDIVGRAGQQFTLYLHPYEFDPERLDVARSIPRERRIPAVKRALLNAKRNLWRKSIIKKVRWLCRNVRFTTYAELARQVASQQEPRSLISQ